DADADDALLETYSPTILGIGGLRCCYWGQCLAANPRADCNKWQRYGYALHWDASRLAGNCVYRSSRKQTHYDLTLLPFRCSVLVPSSFRATYATHTTTLDPRYALTKKKCKCSGAGTGDDIFHCACGWSGAGSVYAPYMTVLPRAPFGYDSAMGANRARRRRMSAVVLEMTHASYLCVVTILVDIIALVPSLISPRPFDLPLLSLDTDIHLRSLYCLHARTSPIRCPLPSLPYPSPSAVPPSRTLLPAAVPPSRIYSSPLPPHPHTTPRSPAFPLRILLPPSLPPSLILHPFYCCPFHRTTLPSTPGRLGCTSVSRVFTLFPMPCVSSLASSYSYAHDARQPALLPSPPAYTLPPSTSPGSFEKALEARPGERARVCAANFDAGAGDAPCIESSAGKCE
ncbi:hypothetical protein DFH06DRAFT_1374291, partial [Mycena polygramma]